MKILYVLNSGRPGGMEIHVLDLIKTMTQETHRVYVWCQNGEIVDWYKAAGAEVSIGQIKFEIDPLYIFRLALYMKKNKIDVVHGHELKAAVNALIAGFIAGVSVKISHTHTPISTWRVSEFRKKLNVLVYKTIVNIFSDKEIALTDSRKRIKAEEGINKSKLVVIPNALDTSKLNFTYDQKLKNRKEIRARYEIPEDAFVFGNISRISEEKGHEVLLNAFDEFLKFTLDRKDSIYLLLAGGGKLEPELKDLIAEKGLQERVFISGVFAQEDLPKYYNSFDAFLFPSLAEGFGLVLIEAMYSELPVICSDLEVLQEVGGSTAFYFETGNSKDLAQKMLNLYQRQAAFQKIRENARERVEELFTLEKFSSNYAQLYSEILESKK